MADLDVPKSVPAPINLVPMLKCEFFHGSQYYILTFPI